MAAVKFELAVVDKHLFKLGLKFITVFTRAIACVECIFADLLYASRDNNSSLDRAAVECISTDLFNSVRDSYAFQFCAAEAAKLFKRFGKLYLLDIRIFECVLPYLNKAVGKLYLGNIGVFIYAPFKCCRSYLYDRVGDNELCFILGDKVSAC